MKRILIVGENSYVGNSFYNYILKFGKDYFIEKISSRNGIWEKINFKKYDVVLNVAGIAHVEAKPRMKPLYYKVNRDLAINIAQKAKNDGVTQFIHMSSMIVYGNMSNMGENKKITSDTIPVPITFYGDSKLQADLVIDQLRAENYKIAIIRPPLIYSERAKGNFPRLIKIAKTFPVFPDINNMQSMIYIDNLCELIRLIIDNGGNTIFYPQNKEYVTTTDMVKTIADLSNKKIVITKLFNSIIKVLSKRIRIVNKAFGNLVYDKSLSDVYDWDYCIVDYKESMKKVCKAIE